MDSILQIRDESSQISALENLIKSSSKDTTAQSLAAMVKRLLAEDVPQQVNMMKLFHFVWILMILFIQVAKSLLRRFASKVTEKNMLAPETFDELCNQILPSLKSSTGAYDEADYILRNHLFHVHVTWGQFSDAAQALGGLNLDSAVRPYSPQEKADIYIKCAGMV
jgi:hypothetical protein